ncbi:unnamed protein product, partial [Nesidiocoris tenuis]
MADLCRPTDDGDKRLAAESLDDRDTGGKNCRGDARGEPLTMSVPDDRTILTGDVSFGSWIVGFSVVVGPIDLDALGRRLDWRGLDAADVGGPAFDDHSSSWLWRSTSSISGTTIAGDDALVVSSHRQPRGFRNERRKTSQPPIEFGLNFEKFDVPSDYPYLTSKSEGDEGGKSLRNGIGGVMMFNIDGVGHRFGDKGGIRASDEGTLSNDETSGESTLRRSLVNGKSSSEDFHRNISFWLDSSETKVTYCSPDNSYAYLPSLVDNKTRLGLSAGTGLDKHFKNC